MFSGKNRKSGGARTRRASAPPAIRRSRTRHSRNRRSRRTKSLPKNFRIPKKGKSLRPFPGNREPYSPLQAKRLSALFRDRLRYALPEDLASKPLSRKVREQLDRALRRDERYGAPYQ